MLYENVTSPFIHDSLNPDEEHTYRLRYTNTLGSGEFSEQVSAKTDLDPYRNVISGAVATAILMKISQATVIRRRTW